MPETTQKRHPAFWPLIWTGVIALVICACFWALRSANARSDAQYSAQMAAITSLNAQKADLQSLISLPPCDAKNRLSMRAPRREAAQAPMPDNQHNPQAAKPEKSAQAPNGAANGKIENIENACVFIVSYDGKNGVSTGSGFFVAPGRVLTNKHVVENGKSFVIVTSKGLGQPARAKILAQSAGKKGDYALLRVDMPANSHTTIMPFAKNIQKTEKVGAWGFPNLVGKADPAYARLLREGDISAAPELSYSEGVVSAVLNRNPAFIVHTAPISPGNSGGPLVNEKGEVVGINTMITLDETSYRQASIALAASDILDFLASNGVKTR